jgi:hypothetical protein
MSDPPYPWLASYTPEGVLYYSNQETSETVWELPKEWNDASQEWSTAGSAPGQIVRFDGSADSQASPGASFASPWAPPTVVSAHVDGPKPITLFLPSKPSEAPFVVEQTPLFSACERRDELTVIGLLVEAFDAGYLFLIGFH